MPTSVSRRALLKRREPTRDRYFETVGAATHPQAALVIWLAPSDLSGIESLTGKRKPPALFVSSTLLGGEFASIPDNVRDFTFISYPTRLPEAGEYTKWFVLKKDDG